MWLHPVHVLASAQCISPLSQLERRPHHAGIFKRRRDVHAAPGRGKLLWPFTTLAGDAVSVRRGTNEALAGSCGRRSAETGC